jgi:FAD-linked sulfhydryl oxidase
MNLHSISCLYPENPSPEDKQIVTKYLTLFQDTITCPKCQSHFTSMLNMYKKTYPNWLDSRYDFFLFICRAHNTVNRRLDKPILNTSYDCLKTFQSNVKVTSPAQYRQSYLSYLVKIWSQEHSGESFMRLASVREMRKIHEQYWNPRELDVNTVVFLADTDVTVPIEEDPKYYSSRPKIPAFASNPNMHIGFKNGKLKLGRK